MHTWSAHRGDEARAQAPRLAPANATSRSALLAFCLCVCAIALSSQAAAAGSTGVRGTLELALPGVALSEIGPVVVYLESLDGSVEARDDLPEVRIVQKGARFSPRFVVVSRGQPVEMPNADRIYHNVFSFSKPNDFDLGLYPAGDSRTVRFAAPGLVKVYCSIHESMSASVLVTPEPYHAIISATGQFEISAVPPGRYRLSVWSERLPGTSMEISIESGRVSAVAVQWAPMAG